MDLRSLVREIPDFPVQGVVFKDLTPLWRHAEAFRICVDRMSRFGRERSAEVVAGIESRGFILGGAVADRLRAGFVPVRKAGKLPWDTVGTDYTLEYGTGRVEMHRDAVREGQAVLLVDDLLATGGTAGATVKLLRESGARVVGAAFIVELRFLKGRRQLPGIPVHSLIQYEEP